MPVQFGIRLNEQPVTSAEEVLAAFSALGVAAGLVEAIQPEVGVWSVEVEDAMAADLIERGWLSLASPAGWAVEAEA